MKIGGIIIKYWEKACKICNKMVETIRDEQFKIDYYFCNNCKFISIDENSIIPSEEEMKVYKQHSNTLENEGYVSMFREFIRESIKPFQQSKKRVLDFGCGPGPVLAVLLRDMGYEVDVYDLYFASEKVYENKTYDIITATEVFEHLVNPLETARFLRDHLNEDGILAVMTLFHPGNVREFKDWWYRRDPTHISFYKPETFMVIAELLGMQILKFDQKNALVMSK